MANFVDQFQLQDQALLTWINNNLPPLLEGRSTQLLLAISRKAFADVTTQKLVDNRTLTTPRISITRLDFENDPLRFNSNRIRRLGFCTDGGVKRRMKSGRFPAPVNIPYQIDLWTRYVSEMNLWKQKILFEFAPTYIYLQIRPDDVWQDKKYALFLEGPISDNSELEPGEGERIIRSTFTLRAESWIYDQDLVYPGIVKRIDLQWRNLEDEALWETTYLPPKESIGTGTGGQTTFNFTLVRPPILEDTVVVETVIGGNVELGQDDGAGNIVGNLVSSGSINYTTGDISITYSTAPDNTESVFAQYFTNIP